MDGACWVCGGSFESVRWNACVHRLDLGLHSHPTKKIGNGVRNHVNFMGKFQLFQIKQESTDFRLWFAIYRTGLLISPCIYRLNSHVHRVSSSIHIPVNCVLLVSQLCLETSQLCLLTSKLCLTISRTCSSTSSSIHGLHSCVCWLFDYVDGFSTAIRL